MDGLAAAINAAGGSSALASRLGMVKSVIGNWRRREGGVPAKHVPAVARVTGLSPTMLRPDLFPVPHATHPAAAAETAATHDPATSNASEVSA